MTQRQISRAAGLNARYVERLLAGEINPAKVPLDKVNALLAVLKVPSEAILPRREVKPITRFSGWNHSPNSLDEMNAFMERHWTASFILTIHHGLDAYLQDPELATKRMAITSSHGVEDEEGMRAFLKHQRKDIDDQIHKNELADFHHRMISPATWLNDKPLDELEVMKFRNGDLASNRRLSCLFVQDRAFKAFDYEIAKLLGVKTWYKIVIIDSNVAMVHLGRLQFFHYHLFYVKELKLALEQLIQKYAHPMPQEEGVRKSSELLLLHHTQDMIDVARYARRAADREKPQSED